MYTTYNIPAIERKDYTVDHLLPLSIGGSNQITSLWPQHKSISTAKLEGLIYNKLEKSVISYKEAVDAVLSHKIP